MVMATVLYIGNRYISDLQELRKVFTKELPSISDKEKKESLYKEINTLFHDNVIQEWLSNGDKEEQEIAIKLNAIDRNGDVSKVNKSIGEAITQEKMNIERHLSDYLQLVEKKYSVDGKEAVSFDGSIEHSTEKELMLSISYTFKCIKAETERFDFLLTLDGERVDTKTINVADCIEGKECKLSFKPFGIQALTKKATLRLVVDQQNICQSEFIGDDALTFSFTGYDSNHVSIKMIKVKGGLFKMAFNYEVELDDYYIGEVPVTQEFWKAVMHGQSSIPVDPSQFKGPKRPVESVSWDMICQLGGCFLERLNTLLKDKIPKGKRFVLPTEAQWEFAARGGVKSKNYKYSGSNTLWDVGWYNENAKGTTHDVCGRASNELKIYDMSGNVSEWCSDWYGIYPSGKHKNPKGATSGSHRVHRGGSWFNSVEYCAVACRSYWISGGKRHNIGFRLVLSK